VQALRGLEARRFLEVFDLARGRNVFVYLGVIFALLFTEVVIVPPLDAV